MLLLLQANDAVNMSHYIIIRRLSGMIATACTLFVVLKCLKSNDYSYVLHLSNDFLLVIEGFIKYREGGLTVRNLAYSKLLRAVCWTFLSYFTEPNYFDTFDSQDSLFSSMNGYNPGLVNAQSP